MPAKLRLPSAQCICMAAALFELPYIHALQCFIYLICSAVDISDLKPSVLLASKRRTHGAVSKTEASYKHQLDATARRCGCIRLTLERCVSVPAVGTMNHAIGAALCTQQDAAVVSRAQLSEALAAARCLLCSATTAATICTSMGGCPSARVSSLTRGRSSSGRGSCKSKARLRQPSSINTTPEHGVWGVWCLVHACVNAQVDAQHSTAASRLQDPTHRVVCAAALCARHDARPPARDATRCSRRLYCMPSFKV